MDLRIKVTSPSRNKKQNIKNADIYLTTHLKQQKDTFYTEHSYIQKSHRKKYIILKKTNYKLLKQTKNSKTTDIYAKAFA